jgi:AraC family transcriptional activator of tynA and feaB
MEWSTDAVQPRQRFSYWREAVCRSIFNLTIESPEGQFAARMTARSSGPLRIALSESTAYRLHRTKQDVDNAQGESYSVYLQLRSQAVIGQCEQTFMFQPGDIAISDLQHPFTATLAGGGRRVTTVIPREMIDRRAPWLRKAALHRLAANTPYVDLARRHILEMAQNPAMSGSAMALLTDNLCNLLALASATDVAPKHLQAELQVEAMLAFCRQELHDPELTPQPVADHLGISVRTLHLRFKQIDQSFTRWVLEERLRACSVALRDENQRGLNISEIAYRWGFNDLSHFNRSFRARFKQTPTEWRNEVQKQAVKRRDFSGVGAGKADGPALP